ncbi:MAG TPA: calcineurin-like phosphoesterase C-terminal domain-containing protein [Pseudoxanthomonas sp.]|nr:calcineurin-like phosphoesterase C-terminal domain-containing protein [Pseudoxanthomonas sp.]
MRISLLLLFMLFAAPLMAQTSSCSPGVVWEDRNADGRRDPGEPPLPGIRLSDGASVATTDAQGRYALPLVDGRTVFLVKPASHALPVRRNGSPDFCFNVQRRPGPALKYGGIPAQPARCRDFGLLPRAQPGAEPLEVLLFADPQVKSVRDLDYYWRDIVQPLVGEHGAALGMSLGDLMDDNLSLLPDVLRTTMSLGVPWMHLPGNHDMDLDAGSDEDALRTYRAHFGPDTYAREEAQAVFIALDNVIYSPGAKPAYTGGFRDDQFAFLEAYLPTVPRDRLLVLGMHIPLFEDGADSFRDADRQRLFELLRGFPRVLVLSGHSHAQRHWYHDAASGWQGATPLHEYNVGTACGGFWSGVKDAAGIPVATMADGTPNGYARLSINPGGAYSLSWHPARDADASGMGLHAPKVLRQGAYPAWGVYANVHMGDGDSVVEYRIGEGDWKPMRKVLQPDPALLVENALDDLAAELRGYDRSPEAKPSQHLWRGALPTDLPAGEHQVRVRYRDRWRGLREARTRYRLEAVPEAN